MKKTIAIYILLLVVVFGLTACAGGDGSNSSSSTVGFSVPVEISAIPTTSPDNLSGISLKLKTPAGTNTLSSKGTKGLKSLLHSLASATDAGTDYSNATTVKFVEENTLEQFGIVEQIMKALAQTHYADAENINQGPYKAIIAWQDKNNGAAIKSLQPWIVDSSMINENGQAVNRVQVWIDDSTDMIKAEMKIYKSATTKSDGSYQDYGVWKLNAKMDDAGISYFAAEGAIGLNGEAVLKIHEHSMDGNLARETKGILNKSDANGYGKVSYPDWSGCMDPNCSPVTNTAQYAYDATYVVIQNGSDPVIFKDRTAVVDMAHRYGMYDSVTGQDVMKVKSFGFPVQYTDVNNHPVFAYYGAWQGRHQLWANGATIPPGTIVTRQDRGPNQTAETYTVSDPFVGTLTKRTLVDADLSDLLNIPVETWVNINTNLMWDGTQWMDCRNPDYSTFPVTCGTGSAAVTDFNSLVINPNDHRKFININRWDNVNNMNVDYIYDQTGASGPGFYVATRDPMTGMLTTTGTLYNPSSGDQLFVNIGGSIYIEYTGTGPTGWVQKSLLAFDERTWTPVFDPTGDQSYTLDLDREFYINNQGANYVVKRTSGGYEVKIEIQTVANPVNAAAFLAAGTVFKPQWNDTGNSTYSFITDSNSPEFLKLVYNTVGTNDSTLNVSVGDIVTQSLWGLVAYENDISTGIQYNWEYPRSGETWGIVTYLLNMDNTYKLLDDPIRLTPVALDNNNGQSKTLSLQYDGWMHGLPDLFEELRKNKFVMTLDIAGKIINIPAATQVTDAQDSNQSYSIKPLEVGEFLTAVNDPGTLDISISDGVDLSTVPVFVEHNMGPVPQVTSVKYSEGILVQ